MALPEHELLLVVARAALSQAHRDRARAIVCAGVDWPSLQYQAECHGLTLLAHRHLTQELPNLCPPAHLSRLSCQAQAIVEMNLALTAELPALMPELERSGCRPVVIKGPALALDVYGDLSSRSFGDLDVVVAPESASRAWDLLVSRGYSTAYPIAPWWRDRWLRSTHEQLFCRPDGPLVVDLHWDLMARGYSYSMTYDEVQPRLVSVRVGSFEVRALGPEDQLVFLCCHGMKHNWERLSWIVDVAELVRARPHLDWDSVVRWARRPGRGRATYLGIHLAHRLLQAPVPAEVLREGTRDAKLLALVDLVAAALGAPPGSGRPGPWEWIMRSVWFRAMERWPDRLRHVHEWILMPRPADWRSVPLPVWAAPAYYAIRPVRLMLKHGASRLRRAA